MSQRDRKDPRYFARREKIRFKANATAWHRLSFFLLYFLFLYVIVKQESCMKNKRLFSSTAFSLIASTSSGYIKILSALTLCLLFRACALKWGTCSTLRKSSDTRINFMFWPPLWSQTRFNFWHYYVNEEDIETDGRYQRRKSSTRRTGCKREKKKEKKSCVARFLNRHFSNGKGWIRIQPVLQTIGVNYIQIIRLIECNRNGS